MRYLGFEINDETFNVFLEYVSGGSVASLLGKFGKFDETFTRSVTVQILLGLEYLHDRRIVHRDIKVGVHFSVNPSYLGNRAQIY